MPVLEFAALILRMRYYVLGVLCQYAYNFANSISEFYKHTSLFEYMVKQYNV